MKPFFMITISLLTYDAIIYLFTALLMLAFYQGAGRLDDYGIMLHIALAAIIIFGSRLMWNIYRQIWRYGGIQCYIRLLLADGLAMCLYLAIDELVMEPNISAAKLIALCCTNTLCALGTRMVYRYAYKCGGRNDSRGKISRVLLKIFTGGRVIAEPALESGKIKIAIVGAGTVGVSLAEELRENPSSRYAPMYFIDNKKSKVGRTIHGLEVKAEDSSDTLAEMREAGINLVVMAIPNMSSERRKELYDFYQNSGFKLKIYDYPTVQNAGNKRVLRSFEVEELLFRKVMNVLDEDTYNYYKNKVVMITGGGGSIGSELCRQIANMSPKKLIILDVYENGAYDIQQELRIKYQKALNMAVEIVSITNRVGLEKVFVEHNPQIVIHAAAHKHVPLMERNCIEAVENNVFGTLNVVELCEKYNAERFMMVSTDKAVNPTNVMGATKRMCEMIVQSYSTFGKVKYSATRFGNVLGSAGSVIPLFKKQIASGGPITITDKRIIRYFMTIPEASQLVLQSGAMAQNGELFVLDMGEPVKILDLAENMIKLSGVDGIEIVETGLRPGEKLYEELLMDSADLSKTSNEKIFIEQDEAFSLDEISGKLKQLKDACDISDDAVRKALHNVVSTYKTPDEVNKQVQAG
ncbi:NDP-sugar epimerase, includes UDP-GlcNAc-inverting 4,6-dehydratase FlaA1 and capsular polysaccharide biosynthesis protein EpsC [Anaerovibrio lipolyticus DSM 3074]|uniref:NDP-sugar epimerase, includes UDP-GlcNAc-inverting 4,6-dehydratase FlaA1 and capsular polysaccharide biosynthesis protein EpsC n=2 Tax=Anaerovibrio lipolyticus TaxID=82374 RepID=A0A1M6FDA9_9FIRM|nr:NDP-sugar epimerase, includes UDP-GlcNAc-inverting 4,6-dehydratase FlaA1 and capsular polysaccharide biosynthesis protein EpsC [Anaerovibrio lipolyticus DSM 3074]